jgi:hypothetical protein
MKVFLNTMLIAWEAFRGLGGLENEVEFFSLSQWLFLPIRGADYRP